MDKIVLKVKMDTTEITCVSKAKQLDNMPSSVYGCVLQLQNWADL